MGTWWKERFIYQIYPRSFKDSNGDGIGDLRGIIEQADYLKWLGVGAVWLCPIYDSPNADMGYDIRDYKKIMNEFGSMQDFEELMSELHSRDIKLVMDLVVNHTSDEHPWFVEARSSINSPYRDFYFWRSSDSRCPPNNWSSFFTPSAWQYDEVSDQWYLHLFSEKQPDLNWENENLRKEVYSMINWWLDKGVDGFRMDVITLLAKRIDLPDAVGKANDEGFVFGGEHFAVQPRLHDYLREMRGACFQNRDCLCVGEGTCVTEQTAGSLVNDGKELDQIFQFDLMDIDSGENKWDVVPFDLLRFKDIIAKWQKTLAWNTLFWSNHDQPRAVSRFGCTTTEDLRVRSAKMLAVALHLLKGTNYIYQGEEIGMTNVQFTDESALRDVESINYLSEATKHSYREAAWESILKKGRDNARTPMQWDNTEFAGFSTVEPWIMVNPNYLTINVDRAISDPNSVLQFYKKLIGLKTGSDALIYGDYEEVLRTDPQIFAYRRFTESENYLIVCNLTGSNAKFDWKVWLESSEIVLHNMIDFDSEGKLRPYEALVFRRRM